MILISGGVGIATLYPIAHYLRERGIKIILFAGAKDKRTLQDKTGNELYDFTEMGVSCHVTDEVTENKLVTDIFREWLKTNEYSKLKGGVQIYSCGPWLMLKEVHKIASKWNIPSIVLTDKLMACGIGACMSCVIKLYNNNY